LQHVGRINFTGKCIAAIIATLNLLLCLLLLFCSGGSLPVYFSGSIGEMEMPAKAKYFGQLCGMFNRPAYDVCLGAHFAGAGQDADRSHFMYC
jgi:hypothetical protein